MIVRLLKATVPAVMLNTRDVRTGIEAVPPLTMTAAAGVLGPAMSGCSAHQRPQRQRNRGRAVR